MIKAKGSNSSLSLDLTKKIDPIFWQERELWVSIILTIWSCVSCSGASLDIIMIYGGAGESNNLFAFETNYSSNCEKFNI